MDDATPAPFARALRWAVGVVLALLAGAVAVVSALPYDEYVARVRAVTIGDDDIGRAAYDAFVTRGRVAVVAVAALAALWIATPRPSGMVAGVVRAWGSAVRRSPTRLLDWARADPAAAICLAGATAVAVALRAHFLTVPLRYDEATTFVNFVSEPFYYALAEYPTPNNHVLVTALEKVSVTLLGTGETALRLPALLAGVLLVPLVFALGHRLHGRSTGLLASAVTATSSTLVEYSTNARGYTLVAACSAIGLLAGAAIVDGAGRDAWAILVVATALGSYAVPIMIYPFGATLIWIAWSLHSSGRGIRSTVLRPAAACLAATGLLVLLLYLPILVVSGPSAIAGNEFVTPLPVRDLADGLPGHVRATATTWVRDLPLPVALALAVSVIASLGAWRRLGRFPPALVPLIAWTLVVVALQRVIPYTRVWLFALPALAVAVCAPPAYLIDRQGRRWVAELATALVLVGGGWAVLSSDTVRTSRETGALLDAPAVAEALRTTLRPGDAIVAPGSDVILQYYLERAGADASPLYERDGGGRLLLVVNVLGDQTVDDVLAEAGLPSGTTTSLVRRWPSAALYVVAGRGAGS